MNAQQLGNICNRRNITLCDYDNAKELIDLLGLEDYANKHKGLAAAYRNHDFIFYDDDLHGTDKAFVVAHEVGHHVMDHLKDRAKLKENAELEADLFATVLMALSVFTESLLSRKAVMA
jgi:Zn-dependent peptidase ImmA (M78 family)